MHLGLIGLGLASMMASNHASAHAQFVSHHHGNSDFWSSLVPEALLVVLSLAGILRLLRFVSKQNLYNKK